MGEAVGVVSWFRSLFLLDEAEEAAEELKQQQARSKVVKNGMNDAAERLKRSRHAVVAKARAVLDTVPPDDEPPGDSDAEVPLASRQLKSTTG